MKLLPKSKWLPATLLGLAAAVQLTAVTATFTTTTTNYDPAGGTVVFNVQIAREGATLSSIGFEIDQPSGWSYEATNAEFRPGQNPVYTPEQGPFQGETTPTLGFAYTGSLPSYTETFAFTAEIRYPSALTTDQVINARLLYSVEGGSGQQTLAMSPITISSPPTAPVIETAPESQAINQGSPVTFSVVVSGSPTPTLQWNKNGTAIPDATDTSYTITEVSPGDAGSYTVTATNTQGSVTSTPAAVLTVNLAPTITTAPQSVTVNEGASHTFGVVAAGAEPLSYQWRYGPSAGALEGETAATLQLTAITPQMAGDYLVEVTNSVGQVYSAAATLTVIEQPRITTPPEGGTVVANGTNTFTFNVSVTGSEPLSFRWIKDGEDIPGALATDSSYTIDPVTPADAGSYSVRVSNDHTATATSTPGAVLVVEYAPIITTPPAPQVIGQGGTAEFTVVANAVPTISSYQWFSIPAGGGSATQIPDASSATLTLTNVQSSDNGTSYYVEVTNSIGSTSTESTPALLTVNESPAFTAHPQHVTVTEGQNASLTASVTGNPTPTVQWQFSPNEETPMADISGATSTTLDLTAVTRAQAGYYQLVATNEFGSAESNEAFLDVQYAPEITTDLADVSAGVGESVTLSVEGDSNPDPTFQWYRIPAGGSTPEPISGATGGELVLSNLSLADNGTQYYLVANNGIGGDVQSRIATLTVNEKAVITADPQGATVLEGDPVTLYIAFTGNPEPTFQWFKNGVAISGATDSTFMIEAASRTDSGDYTVVATNQFGSDTSAAATVDVQFAVEITQDITDQTVAVGSTVTFSPDGDANPEPTFQWYVIPPGGSTPEPMKGETTGDLVLENVQLEDSGAQFYLIASNGIGEPVQTATVTLTVQLPPSITLDPEGATLDEGASHTMTIEVEGDPTPTVQWYRNGSAISGATDLSYTISSASAASAGTYTARATNPQSTVTSAGAVVVVNTKPVITTQPVGGTKVVGGTHSFTVAATGLAPLTYQWKKNGSNISGATSATLSFATLTLDDAGDYTVTVTNRLGSVTSSTATLTVNKQLKAPSITSQPRDTSVRTGAAATLSVVAEGNPLPTYQWRKNGVAISGATSASLTIAAAASTDAGLYDVVVSNSQGSISSSLVKVTVTAADVAPVITSQPKDKTVGQGTSVTFAVSATGVPAPTYQWRKGGVAIAGATSATYTIASPTTASGGTYSVVVTNSAGSVTSRNAVLQVLTKVYAGTYFGSFGEGRGSFAVVVKDDNTGTFLGFDEIAELYISGTVKVNPDGSFSLTVTSETAAGTSASPTVGADQSTEFTLLGGANTARATIVFEAQIGESGEVVGSVTGVAGLSMSGAKEEGTTAENVAGVYSASSGGSDAVTVTIVSPTGKVLVVTKTATGGDAGVGTTNDDGAISVTTVKNNTVTATVSAATQTIAAEVVDATTGATVEFAGGDEDVIASQRLVNISTRAYSGTGAFQTTVAGLVISGEDSKPVLIRAVGPGLTGLGVSGALAAPKLELLEGQTVIASNTGWTTAGNVDEITAAANLAGAFPLDTANADSVLLETLPPGVYTAQASGSTGGSGVVLIEVYDLSSPAPGQKLFNISTRAMVGSGDQTVVAGFVVNGSVPKRVLLRGVGPTMGELGVPGTVADPVIKLLKGTTEVASNDDWGVNADAVVAASATTGAFQLTSGSKDAALIISLEPGVYTLQLSSGDGSSGIGLIEVYEIP